MAVVLAILMVMIGVISVSVFGRIRSWRLNEDVGEFAHTLRLAAEQAVFTGRPHAVVIGLWDGSYTIYQLDSERRYHDGLAPLLGTQRLERCLIEQIEFEDGSNQYSGQIVLYATAQGWSASVVFNLHEVEENQRRYVRCDRLTTRVLFDNKSLELMAPQQVVSMYSPL